MVCHQWPCTALAFPSMQELEAELEAVRLASNKGTHVLIKHLYQ